MEPLGLPRGSVRSIITLGLVVGFVPVCVFAPSEGLTAYAAVIGAVVRDYFGTRIAQNEVDGPPVLPPAGRYDS